MNREEFINAFNGLALADASALCQDLIEALARRRSATPDANFERYLNIMNTIVGENILVHCRRPELVIGRAIVGYHLMMDGLTEAKTARLLGMGRETVHGYKEMYRDILAYPHVKARENEMIRKFNAAL